MSPMRAKLAPPLSQLTECLSLIGRQKRTKFTCHFRPQHGQLDTDVGGLLRGRTHRLLGR